MKGRSRPSSVRQRRDREAIYRERAFDAYCDRGLSVMPEKYEHLALAVPDLAITSPLLKHTVWAPRWIILACDNKETERMAVRLLKRAARNPSLLRVVKAGLDLGGDFNQVTSMATKLRRKEPDGS